MIYVRNRNKGIYDIGLHCELRVGIVFERFPQAAPYIK